MKRSILLFVMIAVLSAGCKKDPVAPAPEAGFSLGDDGKSLIIFNQTNSFYPENTSKNATSYLWNLGNNITSTEKEPIFSMVVPGTYDISLTAINADGKTSVYKRKVKIVVPVLKEIIIKKLHWDQDLGLPIKVPNFSKADIWVEITKMDSQKHYSLLPDGSYDAPLFYKSSIHKDAVSGNTPIAITIPEKVVMNKVEPSGIVDNYEMKLFAKDATGSYLVYCSHFIGSYYTDNPILGIYIWSSDFLNNTVEVHANYE